MTGLRTLEVAPIPLDSANPFRRHRAFEEAILIRRKHVMPHSFKERGEVVIRLPLVRVRMIAECP